MTAKSVRPLAPPRQLGFEEPPEHGLAERLQAQHRHLTLREAVAIFRRTQAGEFMWPRQRELDEGAA